MKNRYLPFGYKIADGKIVADSEQVEAVRQIFDAYTAGQTFQQIADVLSAQGIHYCSDTPRWNKNMVSRSWKRRAHSQPAATPHGQRKASSASCKTKNTAVMCCCKRPLPRMC